MIRVVVVEDSELLRRGLIYTTDWASMDCMIVGSASNGKEGADLIREVNPDLVITDIKMPIMDGLQMIDALKPDCKAIFIIITAYNDFDYARRALRQGVFDYISKPIDDDDLARIVKAAAQKIEAAKHSEKIQQSLLKSSESKIMLFQEYLGGSMSMQEDYVMQAASFISENFAKDISLNDIASAQKISESRLSHIFKITTGYTIKNYLQNYRIRNACTLLSNPNTKVYEAAYMSGFKDQRYFAIVFKKLVGLTPREFQNKLNK